MHLFLDTNILVDVVLRRVDSKGTPLWTTSAILLDDIYKGRHKGSISILSLYIVAVLVNPRDTKAGDLFAREKLRGLRSFLNAVNLTDKIVEESLRETRLRLEDSLQFISARTAEAEAIVTRNVHHFSKVKSEIKLLTPEEAISESFL
ncbi:MAG: hypothetical protein AOA65_0049 [Candidatus Bathyarchaeota archaeon BA1]|nr:MAG: hypothetical protein AOA65_0049 [Candidatus Bathyarchaeota archaeon BA1]